MEYSVQNLEYAVSVFYNSEQAERIQAHQWLTAAQRCPEAWSFVWELLRSDKICTFQGTEVQFFAATTLHTKLLRCWHELPPESYEELQNKIMQTILAYSNGPKIILNRLCISLAAFILQKGASDLVSILRPLSTAENTSLLLEVLTVIPEEFKSMTMGSSLRVKNRVALQQACPAVLDDMLRYLQIYNKDPPSDDTMQSWCSAALCAASWLSLEGDENSIKDEGTGACLAERLPICQSLHNIIQLVFTHNEVISDISLETCEAAFNAIRAAGTTPDAARFPVAAFQLLTAVADLAQPILARDNVPNSINEELLSALATCAVSLAETHTKWIVVGTQQGHAGARMFLELLLATQAAPGYYPIHETRSQLVLSCWYTLQDEILYMKESSGQVHEMWPEVFSRLLGVLLLKSEAPSEDSLSREDAELLRCYRQDIADTVMYCNCVLGQWSWSLVESAWREATSDARREAVLHVFATLADASPSQDPPQHIATLLKHVVEVVSTTTDTRLLNTALECLGSYASWLSVIEPEGREIGAAALRAVGSALSRSPAAAALALKKLCTECSELAAPLAEEIVMAIQNDSTAGASSSSSATSSNGSASVAGAGSTGVAGSAGVGGSTGWARVWLFGAAGAALRGCAAPRDRALAAALADAARADMQLADAPLCKRRAGAEAASALLSALTSRDDLASLTFASLLPALPAYARHPALVPSLFLLLKQAISVLMDDCLPLIEQMAELVVQASETQPCASGLDVVKLMVLFYGVSWPGCSSLLRTCVFNAARSCATDASSKSDLTEGLFTLLQAITKKRPLYLDALKDIMPELVDLGCGCIRLWEAGAARAACRWLSALSSARPAAIRLRAPTLAAAACSCIGGLTPRNQIEPLAEVLLSLNKATWDDDGSLAVWLRDALAVPGFPTHHATDEAKHKFINTVIREKSSKRRLLEAVHEFSLVCRGLVGTEYARQTQPSKQMYIK